MFKNLFKKAITAVSVICLVTATVAGTAYAADPEYFLNEESKRISFTDDAKITGNFKATVKYLATQGVIGGYPDGSFKPAGNVTRAEFAKMMCVAMGLESEANAKINTSPFSDVKAGNWAAGYIAVMADRGIVNGVGNGQFNPSGNVTYEQEIKMGVEALGRGSEAMSSGGYPNGYNVVAKNIGLLMNAYSSNGTSANKTSANRERTARLIYDLGFFIPPVYQDAESASKDNPVVYEIRTYEPTRPPSTCKVYYSVDSPNPTQLYTSEGIKLSGSATVYMKAVNLSGKEGPVSVGAYNLSRGDDLNARAEQILAGIIKPGMSDAEKIKAVNDYLCANISAGDGKTGNYSLLIFPATADCDGYAMTFGLLLNYVGGIEHRSIEGTATNSAGRTANHAWSMVKLDGQWYHVDVTWNDSGSGSNDLYFLKSDATMEKGRHVWNHDEYPAAPNDYNTSGMTTTVPTTPTIPVTPTNPTNPTTPTTPTTPAVETVRVYKDGDWRVVPKDSIEYVPVPDVIGMEKSAALNVLRAAGFSVAGGYDEYSDTIPYNHVISVADMGNGIIEKDGQSVTIKGALISVSVSRGAPKSSSAPAADSVSPAVNSAPVSTVKVFKDGNWTSVAQESLEYVTIPDVVGLELSEARLVLKDAGFLVSMSGEYSSTVPLGYVISATDRTNGTVVKDGAVQTFKGATIAVVLSQGKSQ